MKNKFYAQKDANGFPIPGTMMSNYEIPKTAIEILPMDIIPGEGEKVFLHPKRFRFFVSKDKEGNIIPNSLIMSLKKPYKNVYEFKLIMKN